MTFQDWIKTLELISHPEGGYYKATYRSKDLLNQTSLPNRYQGPRTFSTMIYYLLPGDDFSGFHKIQSDETWHFYDDNGKEEHTLYYENGKLLNNRELEEWAKKHMEEIEKNLGTIPEPDINNFFDRRE